MRSRIDYKKICWLTALLVCCLGFAWALHERTYILAGALTVLFILTGGMGLKSKPASPQEVRRFGLIALFIFGCLVFLANWRDRDFLLGFFSVFALAGGLCAIAPRHMAFLHAAWMSAAKAFGTCVNVFFLTLAWFVVITPIALLKRLFSGRPLPMRPDKSARSYWVDRKEPAQPRDRYAKRY